MRRHHCEVLFDTIPCRKLGAIRLRSEGAIGDTLDPQLLVADEQELAADAWP
jgi:hypothetical protein